ncbi:MAG: GNAT family N-acetyltransferase [Alphaproteobacteria bacterium]|nr:GNAT family N-acetyltransferase [Alphaproteobacteria bacterium]
MNARVRCAGSNALRAEFVTGLDRLVRLAPQWEMLNARASDHDAPFFQSYAWIRQVIEARASAPNFRPMVAAIWRGDELVGVWPLALARRGVARLVQSLDDPFGQFSGIALRSSADARECVAVVLAALEGEADGLHLEAVTSGSALHTALRERGVRGVPSQETVVVDLRPYKTLQEFRQTVGAKTRKNMRNLTNRLRRAHDVLHSVVTEREALRSLLQEVYGTRFEWMHRHGRTSPAFRDDGFKRLMQALPDADDAGLIGFALRSPDATVSAQWGFTYGRRYYAYMSALNPAFAEFSAGRLHLGMVIESCIDRGIEVLELMPPAVDYKMEWTDLTRTLETMSASFSFKGRVMAGVTETVIPAVRRLSRALPEGLRRGLVRRLNKS